MKFNPNGRIAILAAVVFALDQLTKFIVLRYMGFEEQKEIIPGFFKLVHWRNTGAAWSLFRDNNAILAIVALVALIILFFTRHHFEIHRLGGQISLGLIFGGILGNLTDRIVHNHVIDFLRFYVQRRVSDVVPRGPEIGFPAFNVADCAICVGVGLLFVLSWKSEAAKPASSTSRT